MIASFQEQLSQLDTRHVSLKFLRDTHFEKPSEQQMPPEEWCEGLSADAYHVVYFNGVLVEDFLSVPRFHPGLAIEQENGFRIILSENTKLKKPLHVHYLFQEGEVSASAVFDFALEVKEGAECEVFETVEFLGENARADVKKMMQLHRSVVLLAGAKLRWLCCFETAKAEEGIFNRLEVTTAEKSEARIGHLLQGQGFQVSSPSLVQKGEHSSCHLETVSLCYQKGHVAQKSKWSIAASQTESRQIFKSLTSGVGHTSFGGMIHIESGLRQVDAAQQSRHLLLSEKAQAFATPELKIDSDDVKCSHGAAIARLRDEEELYLRTRGIDRTTARCLLAEGFVKDVVASWKFSPYVEELLQQTFKKGLSNVFRGELSL